MGLFTDNPVLERELRGRLRLRRKGAGRAIPVVAWPLGLTVLYFYARGLLALAHGTQQDARELWPLFFYGGLSLIVLLAPALSSTAITQEREQQTWEILATTRLSAWEILIGKWIGRLLLPLLMIALMLPYLLACVFRGGLGWAVLPISLLFFVVTAAFYSLLGLFCSFQAKRTTAATATALTLTIFFCLGTLVLNSVFNTLELGSHYDNTPIMWLNPFFVLSALLSLLMPNGQYQFGSGTDQDPYALIVIVYFTGCLLVGAATLRFMASRYHHSVRERQ